MSLRKKRNGIILVFVFLVIIICIVSLILLLSPIKHTTISKVEKPVITTAPNTDRDTLNVDVEKVELVISDNYNSVFEGAIGEQNISMAIYRHGNQLTASYITQEDTDGEVNLTGSIQIDTASITLYSENNNITLKGIIKPNTADGELLEGTYTASGTGEETTFTLALSHTIGNTIEERYPYMNTNTLDVEEFARKIKSYVIEDKKKEFAALVVYPIMVTINDSKVSIRNSEEFEKNYDEIINAQLKERITSSYTKYLNGNEMGVMMGYGEVWFDNWKDQGLRIIAINN